VDIPFHRPFRTGEEISFLRDAVESGRLEGDGAYTRRCQDWLERTLGGRALLTHSCTGALEMAALLAEIGEGDEVIMPSFTFVSTASAFVLRGAVPVFVDIRPDTLNLDETKIEAAITPRTKAIVPVHYAGLGCAMATILEIARRHRLLVIEDAAQGLGSFCEGRPLGRLGQMGALSFHGTKNVSSGEGGALLLNDPALVDRAEILWQKGTNRRSFLQGRVEKYTWVDVSSSFLPGELIAAYLAAQLPATEAITEARRALWSTYHELLAPLEDAGLLARPTVPAGQQHNGHVYYILVGARARARLLEAMRARGVELLFHYVPLHDSPAGRRVGRAHGSLAVTERASAQLVRLPLWPGLTESQQAYVVRGLAEELTRGAPAPWPTV
jgi:dTDP-4-amino-4,6-dideoxygalactose transaminase